MIPANRRSDEASAEAHEASLVQSLLSNPADRAVYVKLAEVLEAAGDLENAAGFYKGLVPDKFCEKHGIAVLPYRPVHRLRGGRRIGWFPPERVTLTPPANLDENRNSIFLQPETIGAAEYIDVLKRAVLAFDGRNRLILDENAVACARHSSVNGFLLKPMLDATSTKDRLHLKGQTLVLAARNAHNFYHWFFDLIPNFSLLECCGVPPSSIDNVVVHAPLAPFHKRTLELLGIHPEKLVVIESDRVVLECENLLLGRLNNRMGTSQGTRSLMWLRSRFLKYGVNPVPAVPKILIDRADRGFERPEQVQMVLNAKGYRQFRLEELDLACQIGLFAQAETIVSPHGAGLTLLAFTKPGTAVHEFYGEHVQPCFWAIASHLGLDYHNYNGSQLTDGSVTSSNKGLGARLRKRVPVTQDWLEALP